MLTFIISETYFIRTNPSCGIYSDPSLVQYDNNVTLLQLEYLYDFPHKNITNRIYKILFF